MGVSGQRHAPAALYPQGKDPPVPIVQEAGWAPEPVWTHRLEEKAFRLYRRSNLDRPVVQSVVRYHTAWATWLLLHQWYVHFTYRSNTKAFIALMMEEVGLRTSETSVYFNMTTQRYIPEDSKLDTGRRENLKSHPSYM
jgi:hypothetical protein